MSPDFCISHITQIGFSHVTDVMCFWFVM